MRTKNVDKDEDISDTFSQETVLADADREELEQLRAERDARLEADRAIAAAEKRAAASVTLNLPPAAGKGIQVAGRMFYHGLTYQVTNDVKWTLEEAERRCWAHEASLHESENKGRKKTYRAV